MEGGFHGWKKGGYHLGGPVPQDGSKKAVKLEFARRFQQRMSSKGFSQSELARRASQHSRRPIGRDAISHYINAVSLPRPATLMAICKALNCSPSDLIPEPTMIENTKTYFVMTQQHSNGMAKVEASVPFSIALEWARILAEAKVSQVRGFHDDLGTD